MSNPVEIGCKRFKSQLLFIKSKHLVKHFSYQLRHYQICVQQLCSITHLQISTLWSWLQTCCCCWVTSVVSDSMRPRSQQPTGLPRPLDSPGKNTGVGCHFLLQCMKVKSLSRVQLLETPWTATYQAPLDSKSKESQFHFAHSRVHSPSTLFTPYIYKYFWTLVCCANAKHFLLIHLNEKTFGCVSVNLSFSHSLCKLRKDILFPHL